MPLRAYLLASQGILFVPVRHLSANMFSIWAIPFQYRHLSAGVRVRSIKDSSFSEGVVSGAIKRLLVQIVA